MTPSIGSLEPGMVAAAARIFTKGFVTLRRDVQVLPPRLQDAAVVERDLTAITKEHPAVAAVDGGRVLGYMAGLKAPHFKGSSDGYLVPEWGHGVDQSLDASTRAAIYHEMYAAIAAQWMERSAPTHAISLLESDLLPLEALVWNGFGILVVDAIRGTEAVADDDLANRNSGAGAVTIAVAGAQDVPVVAGFEQALTAELAASPVFRYANKVNSEKEAAARIASDSARFWIASVDGHPVGYFAAVVAGDDCADIVQAPDTVNIVGAYVQPQHRRGKIATASVGEVAGWAREIGCTRLAVDFETQNAPARAFWLKHFMPVSRSLIRTVDVRLVD